MTVLTLTSSHRQQPQGDPAMRILLTEGVPKSQPSNLTHPQTVYLSLEEGVVGERGRERRGCKKVEREREMQRKSKTERDQSNREREKESE